MAWKEKWTQASASGDVQVSRQCEFCGCAYQVTRHVEAAADTHPFNAAQYLPGGDNPSELVQSSIERQVSKHEKDPTVGALCPQCNRFSSAFMQRYFPKGLREGLLSAASKSSSAGSIGCLLLALFFLAGGIVSLFSILTGPQYDVVAPIIMGVPFLLVGIFGVYGFIRGSRDAKHDLAQLRDQLARLTDQQVCDIVVKEYQRYERDPSWGFLEDDVENDEIRSWQDRNRAALRAKSKPVS